MILIFLANFFLCFFQKLRCVIFLRRPFCNREGAAIQKNLFQHVRGDSYKWPEVEDIDTMSSKYVLDADFKMDMASNGRTWTLQSHKDMIALQSQYKENYCQLSRNYTVHCTHINMF